jgi:hypothetical protein
MKQTMNKDLARFLLRIFTPFGIFTFLFFAARGRDCPASDSRKGAEPHPAYCERSCSAPDSRRTVSTIRGWAPWQSTATSTAPFS